MKQKIIICELMSLSLDSQKTFRCWEIVLPVQKSVWNWNIQFLPWIFWNTEALVVWWCGVPAYIFFSEIFRPLQAELLVWMVYDRLIWNFAINGVRMNVRKITNPVPGPSRGMLFCTALILVVVLWDAEPKKMLQTLLKLYVCLLFFFLMRSLICMGMCKWL